MKIPKKCGRGEVGSGGGGFGLGEGLVGCERRI